MKEMKRTIHIAGRIILTLGTVAALGWAFVALNPPGEDGETTIGVQESQADIFSMSFAERTSTQKFQTALDRLGHESPRVYDYNGNTVMFSTNQKRGTLKQVAREYMRTFAEEGVNPQVFSPERPEFDSDEFNAMVDASVHGGVIPWVINDKYMAMGGAVMDVEVEDNAELQKRLDRETNQLNELLDNFERAYRQCGGDPAEYRAALGRPAPRSAAQKTDQMISRACDSGEATGGACGSKLARRQNAKRRQQAYKTVVGENPELGECGPVRDAIKAMAGFRYDHFTRGIQAYRSIEAWYNEKTGMTKITASWSDETFDATKSQPSRYGTKVDNAAAKKVPRCPGCRRTHAFQGTGEERGYSSNILISPTDPARTRAFYQRKMQERGWEIPESELVVQEMQRMAGKQSSDQQWLRMRRGKEFIAILVKKDESGRTVVTTSTAP